MNIEITSEIDTKEFREESQEIAKDDPAFSKDFFDSINYAAEEVSEKFDDIQKIDLEEQINSTLDSSADSLLIEDPLQEITEEYQYTMEQEELFKKIVEILSEAGDRIDPLIRDDPMFRKASINATLTMLGVGTFSDSFKMAGKVILGGTAAYYVVKTIVNTLSSQKLSKSSSLSGNGQVDYDALFGDFSIYAKKIYEAFLSFSEKNYFSNLMKMSTSGGPLSTEKIHLLDHAWLLGSAITIFSLEQPFLIDKLFFYQKIEESAHTLDNGLVNFYSYFDSLTHIPISSRCAIARSAIMLKLLEEK